MKLPDKVYDWLKWIITLIIPAAGTAYFGLAGLWGWPLAEEIVGTLTIVETFLGVVFGVSTITYNKMQK